MFFHFIHNSTQPPRQLSTNAAILPLLVCTSDTRQRAETSVVQLLCDGARVRPRFNAFVAGAVAGCAGVELKLPAALKGATRILEKVCAACFGVAYLPTRACLPRLLAPL
jgi:hypothetical protein